ARVLDLLPLHLKTHLLVERDHQLRHRLLAAGEAVDPDHARRGLDEPVAVDRHCGPPMPGKPDSGGGAGATGRPAACQASNPPSMSPTCSNPSFTSDSAASVDEYPCAHMRISGSSWSLMRGFDQPES